MTIKIEIKGLEELQRRLGSSNFQKAIKHGMDRAVDYLRKEIKTATPVLSGQLRASWQSKVSGDGMTGTIFSGKKYGPYVEYGTGVYAGKGRIYPRTARALAWNDTVRHSIAGMKGRFFVKTAVERATPKLPEYFKESFDKALGGELQI